jgi:predicted nuclease of predicted toxin-antitoxin system
MKLLFDQNISFRLPQKIAACFPDAMQVRGLSLENSTDMAIWTFAKDHNYAIVTFDSDFYDLSTYFGHPPKIIWLRTGYKDLACIQID